ncbi:hypothetical protein C8R42DRAFT_722906 [Lentinula raphanica]|nr:hypothetical protein C8R42DRAFT_722906 [Lentinula raphanica]
MPITVPFRSVLLLYEDKHKPLSLFSSASKSFRGGAGNPLLLNDHESRQTNAGEYEEGKDEDTERGYYYYEPIPMPIISELKQCPIIPLIPPPSPSQLHGFGPRTGLSHEDEHNCHTSFPPGDSDSDDDPDLDDDNNACDSEDDEGEGEGGAEDGGEGPLRVVTPSLRGGGRARNPNVNAYTPTSGSVQASQR